MATNCDNNVSSSSLEATNSQIKLNETTSSPRLSVESPKSVNQQEVIFDDKIQPKKLSQHCQLDIQSQRTESITCSETNYSSLSPRDKNRTTNAQQVKNCHSFFRKGFCQFESKCRFSHSPIIKPRNSINKSTSANRSPEKFKKPKSDVVCKFFKLGSDKCKMGEKCLFSHLVKVKEPVSINKQSEKGVCKHFFKYKTCYYGNNCRYSHEIDNMSSNNSTDNVESRSKEIERSTEKSKKTQLNILSSPRAIVLPKFMVKQKIDQLQDTDLMELRDIELRQLKKRFPNLLKLDTSDKSYQINFSPSDPEWPFDVKSVDLKLTFPCQYPKEVFKVQCIDSEGQLPLILQRHINKSMEFRLLEMHNQNSTEGIVELIFKAFIRWLDRNFENIFIEGLKKVKKDLEAEAAGIEFIPHEYIVDEIKSSQILIEEKELESARGIEENAPEGLIKEELILANIETEVNTGATKAIPITKINEITQQKTMKSKQDSSVLLSKKSGTEIKLCGLELTDETGTLCCQKLSLILECCRCRMKSESIELSPRRTCKVVCSRCSFCLRVTFRTQLMHPFMSILGYLDLENCQPLDVPISNCIFDVECLDCNRVTSITGFQYGQKRTISCLYCNKRMSISLKSIKFQTVLNQSVKQLESKKRDKKIGIQEGKPLPENGTCKHYKKSFRWLRFPCCGKVFPCDLCHNEQENVHEMKFATRMICGFCGIEQPFANGKECVACRGNMNKQTATHWEGGKGCREKIKMSRDDKHKFAGTRKTISRKAQAK